MLKVFSKLAFALTLATSVAYGQINLASPQDVKGTLPIGNGGTGTTTGVAPDASQVNGGVIPLSAPLVGTDASRRFIAVGGANPYCAGVTCASQTNNLFTTTSPLTLTAGMTSSDTTMTVASTTGFPSVGCGYVSAFGSAEALCWSGSTSTTLTGLTRGVYGFPATAHVTGNIVYGYIVTASQSINATPAYAIGNNNESTYKSGVIGGVYGTTFGGSANFAQPVGFQGTVSLVGQVSALNGGINTYTLIPSTGRADFRRLNTTCYVGSSSGPLSTGAYSSIQLAVTACVAQGGGRVVIPKTVTPTDTIGAVTGGSTTTPVLDENVIPTKACTWGGSAYSCPAAVTIGNLPSFLDVNGGTGDSGVSAAGLASLGAGLASPGTIQAAWFSIPLPNANTSTTLTDQSGNGYTATFDTATHAPVFNSAGNGVVFNPATTYQDIQFPAAAILGAQCVEMFYNQAMPYPIDGVNASPWLITDSSGKGFTSPQSYFGTVVLSGGGVSSNPIDRIIGNGAFAFSLPTSGASTAYINGALATGQLGASVGTIVFGAATGNGMIGAYAPGGFNSGFNGTWYGTVLRNALCSATTVQQDYAYVTNQLAKAGVGSFVQPKPTYAAIFSGDSIFVDYTTMQLTSSIPYQASLIAGIDQYWNLAVQGQTQATVNSQLAINVFPLLDLFPSVSKLAFTDAGTNDILAGATSATVLASIQNYATLVKGHAKGTKTLAITPLPRNGTAAMETQREALIAGIYSAQAAGTWLHDSMADMASDPIGATQVTPNAYNPTGTATYNNAWYRDGIHPTAAFEKILSSDSGCSIKDARGQMNVPCWIHKEVPFAVLTFFANTSQTISLRHLNPNWQVCGVKSEVTTPFVGTGISALTMSIGDSTGTATTYTTAQNLLATNGAVNFNPNFFSVNGMVNLNFTATGGNFSALTAGYAKIDLCVINPRQQ